MNKPKIYKWNTFEEFFKETLPHIWKVKQWDNEKIRDWLECAFDEGRRLDDSVKKLYDLPNPPTMSPNLGVVNSCAVCGMKFDAPMGYVCTNPRCPSSIT
jgi:hypothetical protein